ncbi:unnamed protein product [Knipowitschia caucasica]|uniref:Peptidase S1 domain-containing protein n=1 Tax=Knipowitschia caucasica TaxID=637954 RepID=A0AAV2L904_KNICA
MTWFVAFIFCLGLVSAEPAFDHRVHNDRVIGGNDARPNQWKWQVSLQLDSYNDGSFYHICGGTIIDAYYVVTAAHCILSSDAHKYRAVLGEYNLAILEGSEQFHRVEAIFVHPAWNGQLGLGHDIAVLRLAESVYDNGYVAIANLPYPGQILPHDFECFVTGWGLTDFGGSVPDIMQEAPIRVVEHAVCSQPNWWGSLARENMICTGGDGVISGCQGDSGGPLACITDGVWRVHGVVSYGPAGMCNQLRKPTVFTRVSAFMDWMYSVMY